MSLGVRAKSRASRFVALTAAVAVAAATAIGVPAASAQDATTTSTPVTTQAAPAEPTEPTSAPDAPQTTAVSQVQAPEPKPTEVAPIAEAQVTNVVTTGVAPFRVLEAETTAPESGGTLGVVTFVRDGGAGDILKRLSPTSTVKKSRSPRAIISTPTAPTSFRLVWVVGFCPTVLQSKSVTRCPTMTQMRGGQ